MKQFLLKIFVLISLICLSQSYNGPESIEYVPFNDSYFVSNSSNGQILELDNNNNLSVFVNNIAAGPHGLELVEDYIGPKWAGHVLYVCSGGRLYGYDNNGTQVLNYNLNGSFLNGITKKIGEDVDLFITDFSAKKLYRYNILENSHYEICSFNKNPNGVYYDHLNSRLLVVCWGWNAPIYEVDIATGEYSTIINTGLSNLDGITMDQCGNIYVSAWSSNAIHKYNWDFSETEIVLNGLSAPADICYNPINDIIGIPNSGNNSITFANTSCNNSMLIEILETRKLIKTINVLGKEIVKNYFKLEIYEDGSIDKKYIPN